MRKIVFKQLLEDYKADMPTAEKVIEIFFNALSESPSVGNNEHQKKDCEKCLYDRKIMILWNEYYKNVGHL